MATITSAASGDFSDTATWVGGVVPTVGDTAVAATGHTVVIDVDVTVDEVTQAGTGKFTLGNGRTLTAQVRGNANTIANGGTVEVIATTTATITGNIVQTVTAGTSIGAVVFTGAGGTLTINGNVSISGPGTGATSGAAVSGGANTIVINGSVTASGHSRSGVSSGNTAFVLTVNGNVSAVSNISDFGSTCHGVSLSGANASVTVLGDVTAGTNSATSGSCNGINHTGGSGVIAVTGTVTGGVPGAGTARGINATGASANVSITGLVVGSATSTEVGAGVTGASAVCTVTGEARGGAGASAHGITASGASSTVTVVGSATGASTLSHGVNCGATTNGVVLTGDMTDSLQGAKAVFTRVFRIGDTVSGVTTYTNVVGYPSGTPVSRVSPDNVTGMASVGDVRAGTVFGYNGELTGTLAVPPVSAVGSGVPVDNTVGVAALEPADVAALVGAQIAAALDATP